MDKVTNIQIKDCELENLPNNKDSITHFNGKHNKKNGGYTILEMGLVLGVVVFVAALAYGVFGPGMTTVRTNSIMNELTTLQQKIHEVYNGQQNGYSGISAAELINSKAYPTSLNATGTTLTSSSSGAVTVTSDDGSGTSFSIQYGAVPSGVCIAVINKLTSVGGWNEIDVGGTSIWSGTSATPKKSAIDSACGASANVAMKFISN